MILRVHASFLDYMVRRRPRIALAVARRRARGSLRSTRMVALLLVLLLLCCAPSPTLQVAQMSARVSSSPLRSMESSSLRRADHDAEKESEISLPDVPAPASCAMLLANDSIVGSTGAFGMNRSDSAAHCCALCEQYRAAGCVAFNWEPQRRKCFFQTDGERRRPRAGAVSGRPPPQPMAPARVDIQTGAVHRVDRWFKSWNIDASGNRQWNSFNLRDPKLLALAAASEPGYLRFGGHGNDFGVRYGVNRQCPPPGHFSCINETHLKALLDLSAAAGSRLVFGLNINVRDNATGRWDPDEARDLITWTLKQNYSFFAMELGNEEDGRPGMSAESVAQDFRVLHEMLLEVYQSVGPPRPKLIGPDIHGFHNGNFASKDNDSVQYMVDFAKNCSALGVPLFALTHHEYIDVPQYPAAPPSPALLDQTGLIAAQVTSRLQAAGIRLAAWNGTGADDEGLALWAGEIGPHNGKSPGCDKTAGRWSNFGDSFWYLDAMASKALGGYSAFCRQDFIVRQSFMLRCLRVPLP